VNRKLFSKKEKPGSWRSPAECGKILWGTDHTMQETSEIIRMTRLLAVERRQLVARGSYFCIYHRFWKRGTICTPGEMIAEVRLFHRSRRISVPLSLRLMLLFDYLARHQHLGQSAAQIAAGLSG